MITQSSVPKPIRIRELVLVACAFLVVNALLLGANPFKGETVAPVALYSEFPGWAQHEFSSAPTHPERSDVLDASLPQWLVLKQAIRDGETGLWNPVTGLGRVGVPDLTRGTLTPSFLLFTVIEPDWLAYYFSGLAKVFLTSLGTFLLLTRFIGAPAAFFGALVFTYSGFNAAWFYWTHVSTAAWMPWLFWATVGWFQTRAPRWLLGVSLATAALMLGGFPAVSVYALYASAFLVPFLVAARWSSVSITLITSLQWVLAILAGFLIVAIPLLATLEMLAFADLGPRLGGTPYEFPRDLALLLSPTARGFPTVEKTLYVGVIALVFSSIAAITLLTQYPKRTDSWWLVAFALALLALSIAIVFAVLPRQWLVAMPAIGTSLWSRVSVMVGFAIAILAAFGFERLSRWSGSIGSIHLRVMVFVVVVTAALLQVLDQRNLFHHFNATAKAADFVPSTPTLEFVRERLPELQSVVSDRSFLIGGTLGAYGIPEWFAHGFKSEGEKHLLSQLVHDPFRSPTAAKFRREAIQWDADLFGRLGVRYVLVSAAEGAVLRSQELRQQSALPALPENTLSQLISLDESVEFSAFGVVLATYHRPQAPSDVRLEVLDSSGHVVARSVLAAEQIRDNENAVFTIQDHVVLAPGQYEFRLTLVDTDTAGRLTAWHVAEPEHKGDSVKVNGNIIAGAMGYTLYTPFPGAVGWARWSIPGELVEVYENLQVPGGPYFLANLDAQTDVVDAGIKYRRLQAEHLQVTYRGGNSGYIVIPKRIYPGWVAYVNGEKVRHEAYLDVMPAIPVTSGALSTIDYRFEPGWLRTGALLMIFGFVLLFFTYWVAAKSRLRWPV